MEYPKDKVVDDGFLAGIYHNLGASYAQMFQFDRAFKALDKSYNMNKDMGTLKQIYYLTVFEPALPIGERYHALFTRELIEEWEKELETARQSALVNEDVVRLRELFKRDPVKRAEGSAKIDPTMEAGIPGNDITKQNRRREKVLEKAASSSLVSGFLQAFFPSDGHPMLLDRSFPVKKISRRAAGTPHPYPRKHSVVRSECVRPQHQKNWRNQHGI